MKKIVAIFSIVLLIFIVMAGCSNKVDEKMCKIEICDSNNNIVAKLENQSQVDVAEFFNEENWTASNNSTDSLIAEYVISVYQEKTKTVIKAENNDGYEKIMEYVTFENSDIVKVSIGGDVVGNIVPDDVLDEYYIASSDFFSKTEKLIAVESV